MDELKNKCPKDLRRRVLISDGEGDDDDEIVDPAGPCEIKVEIFKKLE